MREKQVIVKPNQHNIVRKAERLLEARYRLSTLAIKVITTVISMIDKNDSDFHLYAIRVSDFAELTGKNGKIGGSAYKALKDACNELMDKRIEFDDGEDYGFMITRWLASAEYFAGTGEIEIEISQKLRPLLLQLKEGNYLNYELGNILSLRSNYVIRLYELLKHEYNKVSRYKPNTTAVIHEIEIEWLRKQFKIPDSYQYSSHIKKLIFDKAVEQFLENTDLKIEYRISRKRGKKVVAVEFTIRENDGLVDYLRDLKTFIKYMRKHFVNKEIWANNDMILSVSEKGRIYDQKSLKEYNKNDSLTVWKKWYELAKEDKLLCLKQGTLF